MKRNTTLEAIEDRIHRQLLRLREEAASDVSLLPMANELQNVWSSLYQECERRRLQAVLDAGGGEVICTVFTPRNGQVQSTEICRQVIRRRYRQEAGAKVFTDVLRAPIQDRDRLAYHISDAGRR